MLTSSVFLVMFSCCYVVYAAEVGEEERPISTTPLSNKEVADILIVLDSNPYEEYRMDPKRQGNQGLLNVMKRLLGNLSVSEQYMRFALVKTMKTGNPLLIPFKEGTNAERISKKEIEEQVKLYEGYKHDPDVVITNAVKKATDEDGRGDRRHVPQLVILVAAYPNDTIVGYDPWREKAAQEISKKLERAPNPISRKAIILICSAFDVNDWAMVAHERLIWGNPNKTLLGQTAIDQLIKFIGSGTDDSLLVKDCKGQTVSDYGCYYYDSSRKHCVYDRVYIPSPSPAEKMPSCFVANYTINLTCQDAAQCEDRCSKMHVWGACECGMGKANNMIRKPTHKFYAHCPYQATTPCTPISCSPPTTYTYTFVMPIWAVFIVTLCVVVILVVVSTLCIYLSCFPVGTDEGLSRRGFGAAGGRYRRPHQRIADTMMSMMQTFRHRRGGPPPSGSQWTRKVDQSRTGMPPQRRGDSMFSKATARPGDSMYSTGPAPSQGPSRGQFYTPRPAR